MADHTQATLKDVLKRICLLQKTYSSKTTPDMKERGRLIRRELTKEIRLRESRLSTALGVYGADFKVAASDGITRKTEAPWVRFYSQAMSPTPRDGYYAVVHFERDGSAVYLTLGCGSTIWEKGMLRALPDANLAKRTEDARTIILRSHQSLGPFTDKIHLGAKAPLPKTFEKATVIAKRVSFSDIDATDIDALLQKLAELLATVYAAQSLGIDLTPADQAELEITVLSKPQVSGRQGFGLTADGRKAVEMQAMKVATEWWVAQGYKVSNKSANNPFDLLVTKDGTKIKVEVKGTTSMRPTAILMTKNEIELHRAEKNNTALVMVSEIELQRGSPASASGGKCEVLQGSDWDIDTWVVTPIAFRVERNID